MAQSIYVDLPMTGWWFGTFFIFPKNWECHHPNWQKYFFRGVGLNHQPDEKIGEFPSLCANVSQRFSMTSRPLRPTNACPLKRRPRGSRGSRYPTWRRTARWPGAEQRGRGPRGHCGKKRRMLIIGSSYIWLINDHGYHNNFVIVIRDWFWN